VRVVLDTNVLASAFNFPGGSPEDVYRLVLEGRVHLVTSPSLLAELGRVMTEKFNWERPRVQNAIAEIADSGIVDRPRRSRSQYQTRISMRFRRRAGRDRVHSGQPDPERRRMWHVRRNGPLRRLIRRLRRRIRKLLRPRSRFDWL